MNHTSYSRVGLGVLLGLAMFSACGGDDGAPPLKETDSDTSTTSGTPSTTGDGSTGEFVPVCLPGQVRCNGTKFIEECAPTGLEWVQDECGEHQACECENDSQCVEARCLGPCESDDLTPSSAGCSFIANRQLHLVDGIVNYFQLEEDRKEPDGLVVANPNTELTATVQLYRIPEGTTDEVPVEDGTQVLAPGEFTIFLLDSEFVMGTGTMYRSGGMYWLESDAPVIAYQHAPYRAYVGNDSSLLLPEKALGKDYVVASYNPHPSQHQSLGRPSYFEIIAVEDNTTVQWHAQFAATGGNGIPIEEVAPGEWSQEVKMNRYETLRVSASRNYNDEDQRLQDVSGTVITADKPIWVVGGSRCSKVPYRPAVPVEEDTGFCDPLQELLIPLEHWGSEYVAAHPPLRENEEHYWRIYGGNADVTVTFDPPIREPYTFSSRGDFVEVMAEHGVSFMVNADGPVMPVGYLESRSLQTVPVEEQVISGDPAMYQMVPTGQFLSRYVFATGVDFSQNFVQVIRTAGSADVFLNGTAVSGYQAIGGYEMAIAPIEAGAHTAESEDPFGIVQFGYVQDEREACADPITQNSFCVSSYAYPGGMKSEEINIP